MRGRRVGEWRRLEAAARLGAIGAVLLVAAAAAWWWHSDRHGVSPLAVAAAASQGFQVEIYRPDWFGSDEIVFDIVATNPGARRVDAIHAFAAAADQLRWFEFDHVILARNGEPKFRLDGVRPRTRSWQNPVFTIRTFPENVFRIDGSRPWPAVEGDCSGCSARRWRM